MYSMGVSSKDIQKARQTAKRNRTSIACVRCKLAKIKCSDYRPCKQCTDSKSVCEQPALISTHLNSEDYQKMFQNNDKTRRSGPTISHDNYQISTPDSQVQAVSLGPPSASEIGRNPLGLECHGDAFQSDAAVPRGSSAMMEAPAVIPRETNGIFDPHLPRPTLHQNPSSNYQPSHHQRRLFSSCVPIHHPDGPSLLHIAHLPAPDSRPLRLPPMILPSAAMAPSLLAPPPAVAPAIPPQPPLAGLQLDRVAALLGTLGGAFPAPPAGRF